MQRPMPWLWLAAALLAPLAAAEIPLSGRLETEEGQPLSGAAVQLLPMRQSYEAGLDQLAGRTDAEPAAETFTGDDGRFELLAPQAGAWEVRALAEGYVPMEASLRPLLEETYLPTCRLKKSRPLEVTVSDPAGNPVVGAAIVGHSMSWQIWSSRSGRRGTWSRVAERAVADTDGLARLDRADGERLEVEAAAPGLAPAEPEETGAEALELRLPPGPSVTVAVRDARDRPLPGVLIRVGTSSWAVGLTEEDGTLQVALPADGVVRAISAAGARGQVVVPDGSEAITLALSEPQRVAGRVIDAESRDPLAGALVWVRREAGQMSRTDDDGRFDIQSPARAGSRPWIQAAAPGYFQERLRVSRTYEFEPVLALEPAAAASGEVVDSAGEPVAGAELSARYVADSPGSFRRGDEAHTGSSEDGRFRFSRLTPEIPLQIEASAAGYAPTTLDLDAIEARETRAGLRLVLARGDSLTGRVMGSGEPLAGAELTAVLQPEGSSPMVIFARSRQLREETATADEEGAFEYTNLRPGSYRLMVSAPGFARLLVPGVELAAGGTDLGTLELDPGVEISGRVIDSEGGPVGGAEIRASGQESQLFRMTQGSDQPEAVSAADGTFVVRDRRDGERVDLQVSHSDFLSAESPAVLAPNAEPLEIVLQPGARISGTVLDPNGGPVADATVSLVVEEADTAPSGRGVRGFRFPVRGRTDDTGGFELTQVPSGTVRLSAAAQGWRTVELSALEVPAGGELKDLQLVLERGATVTGRVFDAQGRPAAGVWVRVEEEGLGARFKRPPSSTTGGEGRYQLEGVETGPRLITASNEEQESTTEEIEIGPGVNQLDLRFAAGVTVSGRVVDDGGAPLAGVSVMALSEARSWRGAEARSGSDGAFAIEAVRDGQYQLRATREGYATLLLEEPIQVAGAPVSGIELVMATGGAIVGTIFGLDEAQLPLVSIVASGRASRWSLGQASHDGTYRIADLAPGEWNVQAQVPQGPQARGRVTLGPGEREAILDLDFTSGVVLTGQVLRSGQAGDGLMVQLRGLDVAGWSGGRTDHEGRFRIEGLQPGRHRLEVADFRSGLQHQEEVEIDGDRDIVVEIFTGRIAGRVLDADDLSPLPDARIGLEPAEENPGAIRVRRSLASATSDAEGRFVIPQVSATEYRLKVVREGYAPTERLLTVLPDGDLADLEVRLQPTSGLRLRVLGASGAPVAEIDYAILDQSGKPIDSGHRQADESGIVRLSSAPAGRYELLVGAPGAAVRRQRVEAPGPLVDVTLEPSCRLEVNVAALAEAGAATMRLAHTNGVPFISLGWGRAQQSWELYLGRQNVTGLPAGSYEVEVTASDGQRWRGTVTVAPGAMTRLDL